MLERQQPKNISSQLCFVNLSNILHTSERYLNWRSIRTDEHLYQTHKRATSRNNNAPLYFSFSFIAQKNTAWPSYFFNCIEFSTRITCKNQSVPNHLYLNQARIIYPTAYIPRWIKFFRSYRWHSCDWTLKIEVCQHVWVLDLRD